MVEQLEQLWKKKKKKTAVEKEKKAKRESDILSARSVSNKTCQLMNITFSGFSWHRDHDFLTVVFVLHSSQAACHLSGVSS